MVPKLHPDWDEKVGVDIAPNPNVGVADSRWKPSGLTRTPVATSAIFFLLLGASL
jgi:hypothetical protein